MREDKAMNLFLLDFPGQAVSVQNIQPSASVKAPVEPEPILFESTPQVESPKSSDIMKDKVKQDIFNRGRYILGRNYLPLNLFKYDLLFQLLFNYSKQFSGLSKT